jgi:hypothetical protein
MLSFCLLISFLARSEARGLITLTSIVPNAGPLTGDTRVLVRGTNLEPSDNTPKCKFGRKSGIVEGTFVKCSPNPRQPGEAEPTSAEKTEHCIECHFSPSVTESDLVPFTVTIKGDFSDVINSLEFEYYDAPAIDYIVPMYGPRNGGTTVTVYGKNFIDFDQFLRCSFGVKSVPVKFISSSVIQCVSPYSDVVLTAQPFKVTMNDQQNTPQDIEYYFYFKQDISKLTPTRFPLSGGLLEIEGQYLDPFFNNPDVDNHNNTFCRFGKDYYVNATVISDSKITCVAPPSTIPRVQIVDVVLNNADSKLNIKDWTDAHLPFEYVAEMVVYSIEPTSGPMSGNIEITINGNNFNNTSTFTCYFGGKAIAGTFVDSTKVICTAPAVENPGAVNVSVSVNGVNYGTPMRFYFYSPGEVTRISPICGPRTGYTQIKVFGKDFIAINPNKVRCIFGGVEQTPATILSETEILCDSPSIYQKPYKQDLFNVTVTLNGESVTKYTSGVVNFAYYDFQTINLITPNFGPVTGKTISTIQGEGFKQKNVCNVTIRFGTVEFYPKALNDSSITIETPEMEVPGVAVVQVSLNGQDFTEYDGSKNVGGSKFEKGRTEFYYQSPPLPTGFSPSGGPSTGGSPLEIYGAGFGSEGNPVYVKFIDSKNNSEIVTITCNDVELNKITCSSPKAPSGTKSLILVSRNGQNFVKVSDNVYLFYNSPVISSISPNIGPVKNNVGGNITVNGKDFICAKSECEDLTCRYGTFPYPLFLKGYYKDTKTVLCPIISYSRPEVITIEITMNGKDYTNNQVNYTFFDAFVLSATPRFFTERGGTNVTVHGFGFANTGNELKCRLGNADKPLLCKGKPCEFQAKFVNDRELICTMPAKSDVTYKGSEETVTTDEFSIEVSVKDGVFTTSDVKIRYFEEPTFTKISPGRGPANGGTNIIFETNFHWDSKTKDFLTRNAQVKCKFYKGSTSITMEGSILVYPFLSSGDPNAISCLSPPWPSSETVHIDLTINGYDWSSVFSFEYINRLSGSLIYPACGPNRGETKVTIQGTGFNDYSNLHLKWGTESRPANIETVFSDSSSSLTGFAPRTRQDWTHGGFVYVEIGINIELETVGNTSYTVYDEYTRNRLQYFYYKEPSLHYLYPRGGTSDGGTVVFISGEWFMNVDSVNCYPRCRFGDVLVPAEFINTVKVKCISPPQAPNSENVVDVELSFNGEEWTERHLKFIYFKVPVIYSIGPISGPSIGGTRISIHGANFTADALPEEFKCRFTPVNSNEKVRYIPAEFYSEQLIYCSLPPGWTTGSQVKVDVTFNGIDYTNSNAIFNIYQIDRIFPRSAPSTGSPEGISITGSGLIQNENASIILENQELTARSFSTERIVFPLVGPHGGASFTGNVALDASVNGVDYQRFHRGFQYYIQPRVDSVSPRGGPVTGGTVLSVIGGPFKDFELAEIVCKIGEFLAPGKVVSENELNCVTPVMDRGKNGTTLPVTVAINAQDFTTNSDTFSVYGLIDSAPKGGPIQGGTEVMIKGFGFNAEDPRCRFGIDSNNIAVVGRVLDESHMICTVPGGFKVPSGSQLPLDIPLEIGFSDGIHHSWTKTDNKFRLYENPKILGFIPTFSFVDVRTEVDITADEKKGFFPSMTGWKNSNEVDVTHSIVCRFGKYGDIPAVYVNRTHIRCLTPETHILRKDMHEDVVRLELAMNGQDFVDIGTYTFKGSASGLWVILMWLALVLLIVAILVMLGILISKYYDHAYMPDFMKGFFNQPPEQNEGRVSEMSGPHVLRDQTGAIRPVSVQSVQHNRN